ncbi:MAG: hypothetical protein ACSW76_02545, partial [Bacteroidaceae bacterium]
LFDKAASQMEKTNPHSGFEAEKTDLKICADRTMMEYLIENLLERGAEQGGKMKLKAAADSRFVRFELYRECEDVDYRGLDVMFTPLMNKDNMAYVICRQIIREHDEAFGHPGCRINAEKADCGILIWFTVPAAKE